MGSRTVTYRLADGSPAAGWRPPSRGRRAAAWALDLGLGVVTLGVGWAIWSYRLTARSTTPGMSLLGLMMFASDTRTPATRSRMLLRGLVYLPLAAVIGLVTVGLGWIYVVVGLLGANRRTLYDEWARVVVLVPPPAVADAS